MAGFAALCVGSVPGLAAQGERPALALQRAPVAEAVLASMRGGFEGRDGFSVSFGFERIVRVDGETHTRERFNLPRIELNGRTGLTPSLTGPNGASALTELDDPERVGHALVEAVQSSTRGGAAGRGIEVSSAAQADDVAQMVNTVIQNHQDHRVIQQIKRLNVRLEGVRQVSGGDADFTRYLIQSLK